MSSSEIDARMREFTNHEALVQAVEPACNPWRAMLIGVDGPDGDGKSWLARFLAWQLRISVVELDTFLPPGASFPNFNFDDLRRVIDSRLVRKWPIILEGVFLLEALDRVQLKPDLLIYVQRQPRRSGSPLESRLEDYRVRYQPMERSNFLFVRKEPPVVERSFLSHFRE